MSDGRHAHLEVLGPRHRLDHRRHLARPPRLSGRLGPPGYDRADLLPDRDWRHAGEAFGRGVEVDDAPFGIEDQHAVFHAVDHHVAGDRHQAEEPVMVQTPGEAQPRQREGQRRDVEAADRTQSRDVEEIAGERQQRADHDGPVLWPVGWRKGADADDQHPRAQRHQQVGVGQIGPVHRAIRIDERGSPPRVQWGDVGPHQSVHPVGDRRHDRKGGHHPQRDPHVGSRRPCEAPVAAREDHPQQADRGH